MVEVAAAVEVVMVVRDFILIQNILAALGVQTQIMKAVTLDVQMHMVVMLIAVVIVIPALWGKTPSVSPAPWMFM
jgi:hypothetical protein